MIAERITGYFIAWQKRLVRKRRSSQFKFWPASRRGFHVHHTAPRIFLDPSRKRTASDCVAIHLLYKDCVIRKLIHKADALSSISMLFLLCGLGGGTP
jgi:hypothetical protein